MGSTDVGKGHIPLDLGVGLSVREEQEEDLDVSRFPCARIQEKAMLLAEWQDQIYLAAFGNLTDESHLATCHIMRIL